MNILKISNKAYDILKIIVAVLPLVSTLYIALADIWGWGFGGQVDATVAAIITFINGLLGIFMLASSKAYHSEDSN